MRGRRGCGQTRSSPWAWRVRKLWPSLQTTAADYRCIVKLRYRTARHIHSGSRMRLLGLGRPDNRFTIFSDLQ